jgi:galactose-1-phosphate uridylyltransferase
VLFHDIIAAEQQAGSRILAENDSAIAFVPYFARYAYEVFVAPKATHPSLATLATNELLDSGKRAEGRARPVRQSLADAVSLRHAAAPGAH